ncbi:MAG TPA: DUF3999 domain-containing protein [Vicinamibacterales bacterium]|nr:DUF3999 domain-containing protein [Vicinamibacterales bacterium]
MTQFAWLLALIVSLPAVIVAQTTLNDFARGAEIRAEEGGTIFRVLLPDDVYDTTTRTDLADLRVINGAGESVPHALRGTPRPPADSEWRDVPSFPMKEQTGVAATTQVRIGRDGSVLAVTGDSTGGRVTTSYLLDASALEAPIDRVALAWEAGPGVTFLAPVSVQGSDDLNRWRTIVASAAVAQLQRDGFGLSQNEIGLPASSERIKYLRISWPKEMSAVVVRSARVRLSAGVPRPEIRWKTLSAGEVDAAGVAYYDARATAPVQYIDLELADPTDVATVTVRSSGNPSSAWVTRHVGLFYSLQQPGGTIRSEFARSSPSMDRYWRLETTREGGWKKDRAPRLKVGWHPLELVFLAQGPRPYTLAYGSSRVGPSEAPVDSLLASLDEADRASQVRLATVGESRTLGGPAALEPVLPWRRIALWGVLVAAVAALAFLATRVLRETKQA